jgi:adenylate cyclase
MEWNENSLLKKALALYAGDHVLQKVLSEGEPALERKGSIVELTMLFLDIADLTPGNHPFSNQEFADFTSRYLDCIAQAIAFNLGTLDSFYGDSVSAWWGANGEKNHAKSACECAKKLVHDIDLLNAYGEPYGLPKIKLRIGIHTGTVSLGNYGSMWRLKYSVRGAAVNFAARLCSVATGAYQTPIVISGDTKQQLPAEFPATLLDTVRVKGSDELIPLYAI